MLVFDCGDFVEMLLLLLLLLLLLSAEYLILVQLGAAGYDVVNDVQWVCGSVIKMIYNLKFFFSFDIIYFISKLC